MLYHTMDVRWGSSLVRLEVIMRKPTRIANSPGTAHARYWFGTQLSAGSLVVIYFILQHSRMRWILFTPISTERRNTRLQRGQDVHYRSTWKWTWNLSSKMRLLRVMGGVNHNCVYKITEMNWDCYKSGHHSSSNVQNLNPGQNPGLRLSDSLSKLSRFLHCGSHLPISVHSCSMYLYTSVPSIFFPGALFSHCVFFS